MIWKALSIRQPWAWAIVHSTKRVENRNWFCKYRGPILIHAAKGMTKDEYDRFCGYYDCFNDGLPNVPKFADLQRGGVIGRARVIDCVHEDDMKRQRDVIANDWFMGPFGIVLEDVAPLPFLPWRGQIGFFDVDVPESHLDRQVELA